MKTNRTPLGILMTLTLLLCSFALVGCGTLKDMATKISMSHSEECTKPIQAGCLDLRALNLKFDPSHKDMKGLEQQANLADKEIARRIEQLGPNAVVAYKNGEIKAFSGDSYVFYFWNINKSIPTSKMRSWQGVNAVTEGKVEDVTETATQPVIDPVSGLGKPDRIYRVMTATEGDTAGVSFQAPWAFYTKDSVVMVRSVHTSVYPGSKRGLWITSVYLNDTMRAKNWKYAVLPFLHAEDKKMAPVVAKKKK